MDDRKVSMQLMHDDDNEKCEICNNIISCVMLSLESKYIFTCDKCIFVAQLKLLELI